MNSNDYEERERWKKIIEARERKQRKFRRQYQLVEVKDYLNWEAPYNPRVARNLERAREERKKKPPEGGKK